MMTRIQLIIPRFCQMDAWTPAEIDGIELRTALRMADTSQHSIPPCRMEQAAARNSHGHPIAFGLYRFQEKRPSW